MVIEKVKNWFIDRKESIFFGLLFWAAIGTWEYTDSLTIEIPFMVPYLPEGWDLGVAFGLVSGLSNNCLLIVPILLKLGVKKSLISVYAIGLALSIALIFVWDKTLQPKIVDHEYSFGFLFTSFFLLGSDGVRGTLLFAWIERDFPASFLTAILVGEVSGGFLAVLMSYLQGFRIIFKRDDEYEENVIAYEKSLAEGAQNQTSNEALLSTDFLFGPVGAFCIFAAFFTTSFIAIILFMYLDKTKFRMKSADEQDNFDESKTLLDKSYNLSFSEDPDSEPKVVYKYKTFSKDWWFQNTQPTNSHKYFMWFLTFISGGIIFTFSPAFFSYTALSYSQRCYTLSVSVWGFWLPTTGVIVHFKPVERIFTFCVVLVLHIITCTVLILIALQSPDPPFEGHKWAEMTVVGLWGAEAITGYLMLASAMHCLRRMQMRHGLVLGVVYHNIGELLIGVACFVVIRCTDWFQQGF
ncbi:solute carrier family 52, riboflavin transporter, member 3-like [Convolutriloba macropyga]|uniref:solute carrier family 52, riboflavin transporter, member 3-like n=1 Tax=Convolutriloba macropyga TaxID=536237 RepID=UPI003F51AE3D